MSEPIVIAVDAIGGDKGSSVMLAGVEQALKADPAIKVIMVGPAEVVEPFAAQHEAG